MERPTDEQRFALGVGAVVFVAFAVPTLLLWPSFVRESAVVGGALGALTAAAMLWRGDADRLQPRWKQWHETNPWKSVVVRGGLGGVAIHASVGYLMVGLNIVSSEPSQYTGTPGAIGFVVWAIGWTVFVWLFERNWPFVRRTDT